jgi:hypothetical protein
VRSVVFHEAADEELLEAVAFLLTVFREPPSGG